MEMDISAAGLAFIEQEEGVRFKAYQDSGGIWTDGSGHTGPDVKPGMVATPEQVTAWLKQDTARVVAQVNRNVHTALAQPQFDALVSFTYNAGFRSSVIDLVNRNAPGVDAAMKQFVHDRKGSLLLGLVRRRALEVKMFYSAPWPPEVLHNA